LPISKIFLILSNGRYKSFSKIEIVSRIIAFERTKKYKKKKTKQKKTTTTTTKN
jgi:hypothetical protein